MCYSAALSSTAIYVTDWLESGPHLVQPQLELSRSVGVLFNLE